MNINFKKWLDGPIAIVAGVHGDETAPVVALNKFIAKHGEIDGFIFVPEANHFALSQGTREGKEGKDLNRKFCNLDAEAKKLWQKIENCSMLITLHEWGREGAFAYFGGNKAKKIAADFVSIASEKFGQAKPVEKYVKSMKNGLVNHEDILKYGYRTVCSLEGYARNKGIEYVTTETPMNESLDKRVAVYLEFFDNLINTKHNKHKA